MGFLGSIFGGPAALPGGYSVDRWVKEVEAQREGYAAACDEALAYALGRGGSYITTALADKFPGSYRHMIPVSTGLMGAVVEHLARVFVGGEHGEEWLLTREDGEPADDKAQARFAAALDAASLPLAWRTADRRAEALRRSFLRFAWDPVEGRARAEVFAPQDVFPRFAPDSWSLDAAAGVMLRLSPVWIDGKEVKRFEFWSADADDPRNMIVAEDGRRLDGTDGKNPYRFAGGRPFVPIVSLATVGEDCGYWVGPDADLLAAQRAADTDLTALNHLAAVSGYTIFTFTESGEGGGKGAPRPPGTPDPKGDGRILEVGPDVPAFATDGWKIGTVTLNSDFAGIWSTIDGTLRRVLASKRIPASVVLPEPVATSGYSVRLQNAPLIEARGERIEMHRRVVADGLARFVAVHDTHCEPSARIGAGIPTWKPGRLDLPVDAAEDTRVKAQRVALGLTSAVEIIAEERDLEAEEAEKKAAEIGRANAQAAAASAVGSGRLAGFGADVADAADIDAEAPGDAQGATEAPAAPAAAPVENVAATALNGAQVASLVDIVERVVANKIPRDGAVAIIVRGFQVSESDAEAMLGKPSFKPEPDAAPASSFGPPFGPPQKAAGKTDADADDDAPDEDADAEQTK